MNETERTIRSIATASLAYLNDALTDDRPISDDDTDYMPAASQLLDACISAICHMIDDTDACDALLTAIRTCAPFPNDPSIDCIHDLALDFSHPAFPDHDDCPSFN